jgi:hypothetical protein
VLYEFDLGTLRIVTWIIHTTPTQLKFLNKTK